MYRRGEREKAINSERPTLREIGSLFHKAGSRKTSILYVVLFVPDCFKIAL